jgi:hypothetical protein
VSSRASRSTASLTGLIASGEVVRAAGSPGGIAVHIGARVAALAGAGEVLVSSTVKDLVAGSENPVRRARRPQAERRARAVADLRHPMSGPDLLLHRDLSNVATWFARRGVPIDVEPIFAELAGLLLSA